MLVRQLAWCLLAVAVSTPAQTVSADLGSSSLEDLTNAKILVSSVSRKEENLDEASAAVYVITREDIERSSASSVPELLRGVPGLQVAQLTASTWAVTARGFNSAFANKLLVLIDGRTVYSEVYSGVHWDQIDMPLTNIERIEIIRGPGAAVWGANAVNGVINIITRPARNFENASSSGEFSRIHGKALFQTGGPLGDRVQYHGFASYIDRRGLDNADGSRAFDGERLIRSGGRVDYQRSAAHAFSLLGDIYWGHLRQQIAPFLALPLEANGMEHDSITGGFLETSWLHSARRSSTNMHAYYVDETRSELESKGKTRTSDLDVVNHLRANSHVDLVYGGEFRYTFDHAAGAVPLLQKPTYNNYLVSAFLQTDLVLRPRVLTATLGSKVQDGTLTGKTIQPSLRLRWMINDRQSFWVAVSHAVAAPSLQDKAIWLPLNLGTYQGLPIIGSLTGNSAFKPEELEAGELGYRHNFGRGLSVDIATYVNKTRRLQSLSTGSPMVVLAQSPHIEVTELYVNGFSALSQGVETAVQWQPFQDLQFRSSYSWTEAQVTQKQPGAVFLLDAYATAKNTASGSVFWRMSRAWSLDSSVYRAGKIPFYLGVFGAGSPTADAALEDARGVMRLDMNLKRKLGTNTMLQVGATNLLQPRHLEFSSVTTFVTPQYVPRSFFVRAAWSF